MIDCKITANYFKEKTRMTKDCNIDCADCPLSDINNGTGEYCEYIEGKYPAKAIAIVQKWSDEQ